MRITGSIVSVPVGGKSHVRSCGRCGVPIEGKRAGSEHLLRRFEIKVVELLHVNLCTNLCKQGPVIRRVGIKYKTWH